MSKEYKELDEILTGLKPYNFSTLGSEAYDRRENKYSWNDLEFNMNDAPYKSDTAIIVTSYAGQLGWLKATLASYRKTGCYVILSYDQPSQIWNNLDDTDYILRTLPRPIHYLLAHSVVFKHKTYEANKRTGWFWDVKYAQAIIKNFSNFKYVYCTNGDCIIEKPEGMKELSNILGDHDLMSGQSTPERTIHTADMFFKVEAFNKVMDYMSERMRFPIMGSQSPECLLRDAVNVLNLKEKFVDYPKLDDGSVDYYCTRNLDSTWKKVLGFRNLYAETEYRENNGLEPLSSEYFDNYKDWFYFRDEWRKSLCKYYETKDRRYLMQWWDMGKDSDYDRKFLPLEAYGTEPIYEKD